MENYKFEILLNDGILQEISFRGNLSSKYLQQILLHYIKNTNNISEIETFFKRFHIQYDSFKINKRILTEEQIEYKFEEVKGDFEFYSKRYDYCHIFFHYNSHKSNTDYCFGCTLIAHKDKNSNIKFLYQTRMKEDAENFGMFKIEENNVEKCMKHYGLKNEDVIPIISEKLSYEKVLPLLFHIDEINSINDVERIIKE